MLDLAHNCEFQPISAQPAFLNRFDWGGIASLKTRVLFQTFCPQQRSLQHILQFRVKDSECLNSHQCESVPAFREDDAVLPPSLFY